MGDMVAFLYFLNYFDAPGEPDEGAALFSEKRCGTCHSLGGQRGGPGLPLDRYGRYASPLFLVGAMWSHGPAMTGTMKKMGVPRPRFEGRDIAHLFAYVQKASTEKSEDKIYMVPGRPVKGEEIFVGKGGCAQCHSIRGNGGGHGPDLDRKKLHKSVTEIASLMWNHGPDMWAKMRAVGVKMPRLSEQEISDLVAYLFFIQYFDPPGNVVEGQRLYMEKGCVLCHYAPAESTKAIAPDLSRTATLASPFELVAAMWNHAPVMEAHIRERGLAWPRFGGDEVRDLVEFIRSSVPAEP